MAQHLAPQRARWPQSGLGITGCSECERVAIKFPGVVRSHIGKRNFSPEGMAMEVDPNALFVGGQALAYAAQVTVFNAAGDHTLPFMYAAKVGNRTIHEIKGINDDDVEAQALSYVKIHLRNTIGCALATRRKLNTVQGEVDIFLVDIWVPDFESTTRLLQAFRSEGGENGFCLYGRPIIAIDRQRLDSSWQAQVVQFVIFGVEMNDKVASLWPVWQLRGG